jgi:DNA polymerase III sliding clamp (beta) subunit (PCNA family)
MLKELEFVKGAIAKKDYVPNLTHFHIQRGTVYGYNGVIALSTPIDLNLSCSPKAVPFIKAIETCKETVQLNMTTGGRLSIRSGAFSAFINCLEVLDAPAIYPEGQRVEATGPILDSLKFVAPFIAEDASRPWARGVLFKGPSIYATNNIVAVERWLGFNFPLEVNVPEQAILELLRIGEEPIALQATENSITFHFTGDKWLRCQLLSTKWPDISSILEKNSTCIKLPPTLFAALKDLLPFTDDLQRIFFTPGKISTVPKEAADTGASILVEGIVGEACFNIKQFLSLDGIVEEIDLAMFPNPCLFYGEKLRGAIVGMRV